MTDAEWAEWVAAHPVGWTCSGCGGLVTARYLRYGVCRDCYGTTDDPSRERKQQ